MKESKKWLIASCVFIFFLFIASYNVWAVNWVSYGVQIAAQILLIILGLACVIKYDHVKDNEVGSD